MLVPLPQGIDIVLTCRTPAGRDEYGNDTWTTLDITYHGCAFRPGTAGRNVAGSREVGTEEFRHSVVTRAEVVLPDEAIDHAHHAQDLITTPDGLVHRRIGEVQQWTSQITGAASGIQVSIERIVG